LNLPTGATFPCIHDLILDKNTRVDKAGTLAKYFVMYRNMHNFWAIKLIVVDFLYLINVILNIYFIDVFLNGQFSTYGLDAINFLNHQPEDRIDPMAAVFPTLTKCIFRSYGASGTIKVEDNLCILPINIVNQRLYVFIWYWLILLSVITALSLSFHLIAPFNPVTYAQLSFKSWKKRKMADWKQLDTELHLKFGDWKLLTIIAKSMEPLFFEEFVTQLVIKGHAMKNGDIALKPLTRSRSSTLASQKGLPYKRSGSNTNV
jgi:hypothetical protein